jgi:DNA-binding HxlR family transcriptional regulator
MLAVRSQRMDSCIRKKQNGVDRSNAGSIGADRECNMGHTSENYCRSCTETIRLLQGKWKIHILCAIREGPVRLGQLTREMPTASKKVLTENLRELERAGLIVRRDFGEVLRHVEYDFAKGFKPEMQSLLDHLASFSPAVKEPSPVECSCASR